MNPSRLIVAAGTLAIATGIRPVSTATTVTALPVPLPVTLSPHPRARSARPLLSHALESEMRRRSSRRSGPRSFPVGRAHLSFATSASTRVVPLWVGRRRYEVFLGIGADDRMSSSVHLSGRSRQLGPEPCEQLSRERFPAVVDWGLLQDDPGTRA